MTCQQALRRSKYGNKGTVIDNIKFSSHKEALRYNELKYLQQAGIVKEFEMQPRYELQPGYKKCCGIVWSDKDPGDQNKRKNCPLCGKKLKKVQSVVYVADFKVTYTDGHIEIEDVKSRFMTAYFLMKWKIFEFVYPKLTLKIVTNVRGTR